MPVRRTQSGSAVRMVVEQLGAAIVQGRYAPGCPIPFEEVLAERFGVSRTSVREAVKVLTGKGLLAPARRYGTKVRPTDEWNLLDFDILQWQFADSRKFRSLYTDLVATRVALEPAAARLAAENATEEEIGALLTAAERLSDEGDDLDKLVAADVEFHRLLLFATHNQIMINFSKTITQMLAATMRIFQDTESWNVNPEGHRRIAVAIRDRDGDRAYNETIRLLEYNQQVARRLSESDAFEPQRSRAKTRHKKQAAAL
jgi:GntR family galactonate operon transcriptional repressor